jgi:hypothetical protein
LRLIFIAGGRRVAKVMDNIYIWLGLGAIIVAVLVFLLAGFAISPYQQVTRVELIKAPINEVWETLSNLPTQTYWRQDIKNIQMLDDDAGLRWVEHPTNGSASTTVRKIKEKAPQVLLLEMDNSNGKGSREARLSQVPGGTRITFTERCETQSPFKRLQARRSGGLDKKLDKFIQELKQKFVAPPVNAHNGSAQA